MANHAKIPAPHPAPSVMSSARPRSRPRNSKVNVGHRFNERYRLIRILGQGGMGVVYEAYDEQVERSVAIKLVRKECLADEKFMSRFARELEITARLRHPSTIRVFEHGSDAAGRPYMVMELLRGESLADLLDRGAIEENLALEYALQIAESLSEAHEHGIFHRDLKPENIYIESVGVSTVIKVLDFGIAGERFQNDRLTNAGEVFGTPQYMSPEQCNGAALDPRTDIYSLGCIMFEMLEGRPPFSCETPMATMLKHVQSKVPRMRNASRECARLIMQTLRKDRSKRIQTCATLATVIQDHLRNLELAQSSPSDVNSLLISQELPIVGTAITGKHDSATQEASQREREQRTKRMLPLLAGAFLLAAGALFLLDTDRAPQAKAKKEVERAALPATVELPESESDAKPINYALFGGGLKHATASLDDQEPCKLPCRLQVPVGDGIEHRIIIKKRGYVPKTLRWRPKSVTEAPPRIGKLKRK